MDEMNVNAEVCEAQGMPDSEKAAGVVASVLLAVVEQASGRLSECNGDRDRVLIPEIRVSDVTMAVTNVRPQVLGALANACGSGARRLASMQGSITSRIAGRK